MSLAINDAPDKAEIAAVLQNARERLGLWMSAGFVLRELKKEYS